MSLHMSITDLINFFNVKSILLDGEFVLIFEKLNEGDERETREGVLAQRQQSIIFLVIASGSVLKLLGPPVKMFNPSKYIKHSKNRKF